MYYHYSIKGNPYYGLGLTNEYNFYDRQFKLQCNIIDLHKIFTLINPTDKNNVKVYKFVCRFGYL